MRTIKLGAALLSCSLAVSGCCCGRDTMVVTRTVPIAHIGAEQRRQANVVTNEGHTGYRQTTKLVDGQLAEITTVAE